MEEIVSTIVVALIIVPPLGIVAKMIGEWAAHRKIKKLWKGRYR